MGFGDYYFEIGIYLRFDAWNLEFHLTPHASIRCFLRRITLRDSARNQRKVMEIDFPKCNGGKLYRTMAGEAPNSKFQITNKSEMLIFENSKLPLPLPSLRP